jgi:hypothetical protein
VVPDGFHMACSRHHRTLLVLCDVSGPSSHEEQACLQTGRNHESLQLCTNIVFRIHVAIRKCLKEDGARF